MPKCNPVGKARLECTMQPLIFRDLPTGYKTLAPGWSIAGPLLAEVIRDLDLYVLKKYLFSHWALLEGKKRIRRAIL